jgi:hypothetical protein
MYWFITYSWVDGSERILAHDVFEGDMSKWIGQAFEQPESWILLNQVELTREQFDQYRFAV